MTDWKKLEDDVDNAIKNGCPINFDSKKPEERKYLQKCAEIYLSIYGIQLSISFLAVAVGLSFIIFALSDSKMLLLLIPGGILLIIGICVSLIPQTILARSNMKNCRRIILNAEKGILSADSTEPKQSQEKKAEPIDKIKKDEHIKGIFGYFTKIIEFTTQVGPYILSNNLRTVICLAVILMFTHNIQPN